MSPSTSSSPNLPFVRNLASSDRKLRTASLTALQTYLTTRRTSTTHPLTELDCLKLWKPLFISLWMCDRPLPQQALCTSLASLHTLLRPEQVPIWFSAFWKTVAKEWTTGIESLRMNKFLLLVRRMVGAMLSYPGEAKVGWTASAGKDQEGTVVDMILEVLKEWPFEPEIKFDKMPLGLRLHVLDVWVDELEKAGLLGEDLWDTDGAGRKDQADREAKRAMVLGIKALAEGLSRCSSKTVRVRMKEELEDSRLPWNKAEEKKGGEDEKMVEAPEENDGWGGFED